MRVLLDESLPRKLASALIGHVAQTVQRRGWSGLKNGALIRAASQEFDVFLTGDQNLQYQQNLSGLSLSIVALVAWNNRIETLMPLVPELLRVLGTIEPGRVVTVPAAI